MANDNKAKRDNGTKEEKKNEAPKAEVVETKPEPQAEVPRELTETPKPVVALTVLEKAKVRLVTPEELEALERTATAKRQVLEALLTDAALAADVKTALGRLVEMANPQKAGMEEVSSDWVIPILNIVQPTTNSSAKPESAKQGDLFTSAGQILGRPWSFIPLWFNYENVYFKDQSSKVPECVSPDGKVGSPYGLCQECPFLKFGPKDDRTTRQDEKNCNGQIVVTALDAALDGIFTMRFAKTSYTAGRALMSLARAQASAYKQSYLLSTEKKTGDKGLYYVYKVEPTGKDNDEHKLRIAAALCDMYGATRKMLLAKWYLGRGSNLQAQIAAEEAFNSQKLDGGLGLSGGGEEPDFSGTPPTQTSNPVRHSSKPM